MQRGRGTLYKSYPNTPRKYSTRFLILKTLKENFQSLEEFFFKLYHSSLGFIFLLTNFNIFTLSCLKSKTPIEIPIASVNNKEAASTK